MTVTTALDGKDPSHLTQVFIMDRVNQNIASDGDVVVLESLRTQEWLVPSNLVIVQEEVDVDIDE